MGCLCSTDTKDIDAKTLARYHEQARKRWQEKAEAVEREQQEIRRRARNAENSAAAATTISAA